MTSVRSFDDGIRFARHALLACCLVGQIFALPAAAQETAAPMQGPRVSTAAIDWDAVRGNLAGVDAPTSAGPRSDASAPDPLTTLNAASAKLLPNIAASAVPVLLPFDTAAMLRDDAQGSTGAADKYLSGFAISFFDPGPSGYDAMLTLEPHDIAGLDLAFARRVDVQISGSALLYELDPPVGAEDAPAAELEGKFPGIRRVLLEDRVRYTFVRFGVPYFVSILCADGPTGARRLSCREADKVAVRLLAALNVVGGSPQRNAADGATPALERPDHVSPDFTYYAPGDLLPGTGMRGQSGSADATVYANIRFPIAQGPDYVNSQSFMDWGDCNYTGRIGLGDGGYRCRVNDRPLVKDESRNYAYPWRDNFCEHRHYYVGQCPSGLGHQGEDIRPASCLFRNDGADRCDPYQHDIVAVADGVVMRDPGDEALYLVVNAPGEHVRFRYLHLNPRMLDAAGMVNGRALVAGEVIGAVDDYNGRIQGGTTYHLHLDMQVPSRDGWVFVNPYMTLVAAYERLIGGRGQVVSDANATTAEDGPPAPDSAAPDPSNLADPSKAAPSEAIGASGTAAKQTLDGSPKAESQPKSETGPERQASAADPCATRFIRGHRRRFCGNASGGSAGRPHRAAAVRSGDRRVSHRDYGERYHRNYVHARHAGSPS